MDDPAAELLRTRIARLDEAQPPVVSFDADQRLLHFINVMASYTNTTFGSRADGPPVLLPDDADEAVGTCRLLTDIARDETALVDGPLDHAHQQWIRSARQSTSPTPSGLVEATDSNAASSKPLDLGMYTSTTAANGRSMWRTYLDSVRGSTLHPLPWRSWRLYARDDAAVLEITSAREWADFVSAYPRAHADMIYPDWRSTAHDFDGIHLTLRAILAIQGFAFPIPQGLSAPAYWDIESTLWLRWCFTSIDLFEVIDDT